MDSLVQRSERIVAALEDLIDQEAAAFANRDWPGVIAVQDRTAPLIDFLCSPASNGAHPPEIRARIAALHARRNRTSTSLAHEIESTRGELQQTQVARRRVAQIAPVYGHTTASRHRLQAVG